jgi:hypothetical protein
MHRGWWSHLCPAVVLLATLAPSRRSVGLMDADAWAHARKIAERQQWLVTAAQLRALNLSRREIDGWLRSRGGLALLRGVYLFDSDMYDDLPDSMWWRAALLKHGPAATLAGRTGARALGVQGLPARDDVLEVALVGGSSRATSQADATGGEGCGPLVVVRQLPLSEAEVVTANGLRVRAPSKTVVDAAIQLDRVHALCVLDSALCLELLTRGELATAVAEAAHRRGCRLLRDVAALADERSQSPLESRVRLACIDGDLAPDDLQYEVKVPPGIVLAVGDLAWFRRRRRPLLAEADGESVHGLPKPVFRDRRRGNALVGRACDTVRFVWADALRPAYIQYVVREALTAG